ncbi:hypothetical protein OEZ86_003950 [Tetradesmus obliquus]|nr:hypothetical protein OEZ86_003950 [Tetradesmus obliquus]
MVAAPGSINSSLGGLLLDLGLAAAGRAGDWHAGAAVVSSARTIQAGGKGSSSRSSRGSADVAPEGRRTLEIDNQQLQQQALRRTAVQRGICSPRG